MIIFYVEIAMVINKAKLRQKSNQVQKHVRKRPVQIGTLYYNDYEWTIIEDAAKEA
jgi:hypothetical protein